ncbi:hypothetical protein [Ottowia oryzae]|uniref:Uncharacterized protein n=1 Tax=Ottowia oryzae TaxID=2109914 RepID=A0A2S0MCW9_9BURK|nr:hypothetical protein [Ottowia oryzae]AVO33656.1 hypothetical protein C6570_04830 [Ottowia oryzae]
MSRAVIALGGLLLALGAGAGGYWWGHGNGKAAEVARRDADTVAKVTAQLEAHQGLIDDANAASAALRGAAATRAANDRKFSKEFRDALKNTAGDRAGCRFDDDSVRQLGAARERAAQAAAGGLTATVPRAGPGAGK